MRPYARPTAPGVTCLPSASHFEPRLTCLKPPLSTNPAHDATYPLRRNRLRQGSRPISTDPSGGLQVTGLRPFSPRDCWLALAFFPSRCHGESSVTAGASPYLVSTDVLVDVEYAFFVAASQDRRRDTYNADLGALRGQAGQAQANATKLATLPTEPPSVYPRHTSHIPCCAAHGAPSTNRMSLDVS